MEEAFQVNRAGNQKEAQTIVSYAVAKGMAGSFELLDLSNSVKGFGSG